MAWDKEWQGYSQTCQTWCFVRVYPCSPNTAGPAASHPFRSAQYFSCLFYIIHVHVTKICRQDSHDPFLVDCQSGNSTEAATEWINTIFPVSTSLWHSSHAYSPNVSLCHVLYRFTVIRHIATTRRSSSSLATSGETVGASDAACKIFTSKAMLRLIMVYFWGLPSSTIRNHEKLSHLLPWSPLFV